MPRTKKGTPKRIERHFTLDPDIDAGLDAYLAEHPGQTASMVADVAFLWFLSVKPEGE